MKMYMTEVGIASDGVLEQRVYVDREAARSAASDMRSRFPNLDRYYYVVVRGPFAPGEDTSDVKVPVEDF